VSFLSSDKSIEFCLSHSKEFSFVYTRETEWGSRTELRVLWTRVDFRDLERAEDFVIQFEIKKGFSFWKFYWIFGQTRTREGAKLPNRVFLILDPNSFFLGRNARHLTPPNEWARLVLKCSEQ
jgi:hypothetical protein